ncbi:MAG: amidase, partial [Actinomycetes bacterium]
MTDVPFASALDAADAVRRKEVSPAELMDLYLDRADRLDPSLNAFALRDDDRARELAAAATDVVAGTPAAELPPFHGVPMPIKDLDDVVGWPTSFGSFGCDPSVRTEDALEVSRLRSAGFVFMGKTTTPEFGTVSMTESERFGATRNPWNTDHTPGGSSGGAAAAVASGMAPLAHASDGGGSIRIPASCTGLVGLKASRNRITGVVEAVFGASTNGVVSWTVADTAAALDVLVAYDTGSWNLAQPPSRPYRKEVGADPGRLRIMVQHQNALGVPPAPECVAAVDGAAALLESLG